LYQDPYLKKETQVVLIVFAILTRQKLKIQNFIWITNKTANMGQFYGGGGALLSTNSWMI
jgi:hypothetical protein